MHLGSAILSLALTANALGSPLPLELSFQSNGYAVEVGGTAFFSSTGPSMSVDGAVFSAAAGSLRVIQNTTTTGSDGIGSYTAYAMQWRATDSASTPLITTFFVYDSGDAIAFETSFPDGLASQARLPSMGGLSVTFPSLSAASSLPATLGILVQAPNSGNCGWTVYSDTAGFPTASGGLQVMSSPIASLGFAALTAQPVVRQAVSTLSGSTSLSAGPGAEFNLPPGFTSATILVAALPGATSSLPMRTPVPGLPAATRSDLGYPLGGPNAALTLLGDTLLAAHGKMRPRMNFDRIHETLGVGSTVFYFYNPCDCGRFPNNTCPPDDGRHPFRTPKCMTYADSLLAAATAMRAQGIPFGHMLLDSFWYGEGIYNGVSEWEDDPSLMVAVQSFPNSLAAFSAALGQGVVLWAHNGMWVQSSPYMKKYPFAPGTSMPQDRQMWDHVFAANAATWNLRMIKQDHVGQQIDAAGTITNASQISSWLGGMGEAAVSAGMNIQYCCSPPLVLHNSVNVPTAVSARSSPDYVTFAHDTQVRPRFQWANGVESAFHYSLGLVPDKDGFYSNSSEVQHGGDGLPSQFWPSFYNGTSMAGWTEANPTVHALMAVCSGGPVAPGDRPGSTNATLMRSLMRSDGTLLRASRPHSALDAELEAIMSNGSGEAGGDGGLSSRAGNPDGSFPNAGRGEVYSSVTLLPASSSPATSACVRYSTVTAMELITPLNISAAAIALDGAALATSSCTGNGGAWASYFWDLNVFGPSTARGQGVHMVFDGTTDTVTLPATAAAGYAGLPTLLMVGPVVGGWLVLGEAGKMLPASPQRVTFLAPATTGTGVDIGLQGSVGEAVRILACAMGPQGCSAGAAPQEFDCTLPASGLATLTLPAGVCA